MRVVTEIIVAIDPGMEKCGWAVVTSTGQVLHKGVTPVGELAAAVVSVQEDIQKYVVGDGTATANITERLERAGVPPHSIILVDEYKSSEVGRVQYWRDNPPRGWRRLLPTGMQVPPVPYDDYVAVELARRYFGGFEDKPDRQ